MAVVKRRTLSPTTQRQTVRDYESTINTVRRFLGHFTPPPPPTLTPPPPFFDDGEYKLCLCAALYQWRIQYQGTHALRTRSSNEGDASPEFLGSLIVPYIMPPLTMLRGTEHAQRGGVEIVFGSLF